MGYKLNPENGMDVLVAELNPSYLWGSEDQLLIDTYICVVNEFGVSIFCPMELPQFVHQQIKARNDGLQSKRLEWKQDDTNYLGYYWSLFLEPNYVVLNWGIVASKEKDIALAPMSGFRNVFLPVMLTIMLLALLISVVQIRKKLKPLEKLMEGTRSISSGKFDKKVIVNSDDEFEDLATSFNIMSDRVHTQFKILQTLSDLDQAILSEFELRPVIKLLLDRIFEIIPCSSISVRIAASDAPGTSTIYVRRKRGGMIANQDKSTLSAKDVDTFLEHPNGIVVTNRTKWSTFLRGLYGQSFYIQPIILENDVVGVICVAFDREQDLAIANINCIKDFAHRIAVSVSASRWEDKLRYQAHYDTLTGLPNRELFKDRLAQAIKNAKRNQSMISLIYLDLDRFKYINDSLGHSAGDELLQLVGQRLRQCVRNTDTVARLGGDEFTIIMSGFSDPEGISAVMENIIYQFSKPFTVSQKEYFASASLGVAVYPADGDSGEELLKNADIAMYEAKKRGRNRFLFYEDEMNIRVIERGNVESGLQHAIEHREFTAYYQPKMDILSGEVCSAEALLRWHHPIKGLLHPLQVIPVAEDIGLIEPIGHFMLETACRQFLAWRKDGIHLTHIAVNVSPLELWQTEYVEKLLQLLNKLQMPGENLELEITEGVFLENTEKTAAVLKELKEAGIKLTLDDFGTGYSSLGYLTQYPIDAIKIDQSFIHKLGTDKDAADIILAIVGIAHNLDIEIVAEGVETQTQLNFLSEHQCTIIQGQHFAHALSEPDFRMYMNKHKKLLKASSS